MTNHCWKLGLRVPADPSLLCRGQRHLDRRQHGEGGQVWTKGTRLLHLGSSMAIIAIMAMAKNDGAGVH